MGNLLKQEFSASRGSLRFPAADDVLIFFIYAQNQRLFENSASVLCFFYDVST